MLASKPSIGALPTLLRNVSASTFTSESWKLAVPAVLYTIQNSLQYVAVSNLDAATFQVTYQLKILTTAIFSVLMLGRVLSPRKWLSLLLLLIGVAIIQLPQDTIQRAGDKLKGSDAKLSTREPHPVAEGPEMNKQLGLIAVLIACALSGLAGVTFEKILKSSTNTKPTSLWIRNCQLSFWSLFPALFIGVMWKDGEIIAKTGFFAGYNWVVWTAIMFQAAGGVIVALVINYADNIAKNFATSISILLSCIASVYFFSFQITAAVSSASYVRLLFTDLSAVFPRYLRCPTCYLSVYQAGACLYPGPYEASNARKDSRRPSLILI